MHESGMSDRIAHISSSDGLRPQRGDRQPFDSDIPDDTQRRRKKKKKKKACDEGEFICRICVILKRPPRQ